MTTPIFGSSRALSNALDISNTVVGRKALRTSGRLIVILAIPSQVSYTTPSYTPPSAQPARLERPSKLPLLERSLALSKIIEMPARLVGRLHPGRHQPP